MGLFLDKPQTQKESDSGGGNNLRYGYSAMQGWRVEMEDAHSIHVEIHPNLKNHSYFAVLDGHAGEFTSAYSSKALLEEILEVAQSNNFERVTSSDEKVSSTDNEDESTSENKISDDKNTSTEQNCSAEKSEELTERFWKSCIHEGYLSVDEKLKKLPEYLSGKEKSGSTVVSVFVTPKSFIFANCGDSRAVLCRDGEVHFSTSDHKPYNEEEQARIEKAGGSVVVQRVNGSLALSRALGDFDYKNRPDLPVTEQLVIAVPEISFIERSYTNDEFLLIACDGIWDVMSNEELVIFIRTRLLIREKLEIICEELLETCLAKGSKDNMSAILVTLEAAPKVCEKALEREKKLHESLKEHIAEIVKECDTKEIQLNMIVNEIEKRDVIDFPPGVSIHSEFKFIEATLDELVPDRIKEKPNSFISGLPMVVDMLRNASNAEPEDSQTTNENNTA